MKYINKYRGEKMLSFFNIRISQIFKYFSFNSTTLTFISLILKFLDSIIVIYFLNLLLLRLSMLLFMSCLTLFQFDLLSHLSYYLSLIRICLMLILGLMILIFFEIAYPYFVQVYQVSQYVIAYPSVFEFESISIFSLYCEVSIPIVSKKVIIISLQSPLCFLYCYSLSTL